MTTVELTRSASTVIPPVGTTGWRITALDARGGFAVVPILFGRLDGKPVFRGSQADCHRFHDLLTGAAPAPRRAQDATLGTAAPTDASPGLTAVSATPADPPSGAASRAMGAAPAPHTVATQPTSAVPTARSGGGQMSFRLRGGGTA